VRTVAIRRKAISSLITLREERPISIVTVGNTTVNVKDMSESDQSQEMKQDIARRDVKKGLRLGLRHLSRTQVLSLVHRFLWKRPEPGRQNTCES
jgi:hypothetical protein